MRSRTFWRSGCFQYVKDTKKKANHNSLIVFLATIPAVSYTSKILKRNSQSSLLLFNSLKNPFYKELAEIAYTPATKGLTYYVSRRNGWQETCNLPCAPYTKNLRRRKIDSWRRFGNLSAKILKSWWRVWNSSSTILSLNYLLTLVAGAKGGWQHSCNLFCADTHRVNYMVARVYARLRNSMQGILFMSADSLFR